MGLEQEFFKFVHNNSIEALISIKKQHPNLHWSEFKYPKTGDTPLHVSARLGRLPVLDFLLTFAPNCVDCKNNDCKTALHEAAQFARWQAVALLVNHGADVNALKRADWTPLMLACTKRDNLRTVTTLLENGALINYRNKDGWTSLHLISREGDPTVLKLLIDSGLDCGALTNNGRTGLHVAALHKNVEVAKILLRAGLDPNSTDKCGNTPVLEAVLGGDVATLNLLLANGGDLTVQNSANFGAIHLAASLGDLSMIKHLHEKGPIAPENRLTPLHCAARKNQIQAVHLLIELGADPDATDQFGRSYRDYLNK